MFEASHDDQLLKRKVMNGALANNEAIMATYDDGMVF